MQWVKTIFTGGSLLTAIALFDAPRVVQIETTQGIGTLTICKQNTTNFAHPIYHLLNIQKMQLTFHEKDFLEVTYKRHFHYLCESILAHPNHYRKNITREALDDIATYGKQEYIYSIIKYHLQHMLEQTIFLESYLSLGTLYCAEFNLNGRYTYYLAKALNTYHFLYVFKQYIHKL